MVRTLLFTGLTLSALPGFAAADPITLSGQQLDRVTAGGANFVLTPGTQPDGKFHTSEGQAQTGTVVFPELRDAQGFNFVLPPGQPEGNFVEHNGQVQRSTIID